MTGAQNAPVVRIPYWLASAERTDLARLIVSTLTASDVLPTLEAMLGGVLTELGVAEARDRVWPDRTSQVRAAAGLDLDVLPVRMSREEIEAVRSLPDLPVPVRDALHHPVGRT